MTPEDALEYMKKTGSIVIVDVAATKRYDEKHFEGAINIPIEELSSGEEDKLYMKIPAGRPVIMHCRRGMIVPGAYRRVLELRKDIPEIGYIAGAPLFDEHNAWLKTRQGEPLLPPKSASPALSIRLQAFLRAPLAVKRTFGLLCSVWKQYPHRMPHRRVRHAGRSAEAASKRLSFSCSLWRCARAQLSARLSRAL